VGNGVRDPKVQGAAQEIALPNGHLGGIVPMWRERVGGAHEGWSAAPGAGVKRADPLDTEATLPCIAFFKK